jgi:N-acetylglucosamine kinase-like BadF-type ATPase
MNVLGIDAGGTKTVCLLADEHGTVLASARGGGANLQVQGELEVEKTLHDVMDRALAGRTRAPDAACLGIAGVDRPGDRAVIHGIMRRIGFKMPTRIVNDALIALVAGVGAAPGIVIVCGTGSICYGRDERNRAARAGGWGYIIGDEGSGYWIGRRALAAVARQEDGRGPHTALSATTLAHLEVGSLAEIVHEIHVRDPSRHRVTGLAAGVHAAAEAGDAIALTILDDAARELLLSVRSVATRLGMLHGAFPIVLSGGMFQGLPILRERVLAGLSGIAPHAQPLLLTQEPALGAVRLAVEEARGGAIVPEYF